MFLKRPQLLVNWVNLLLYSLASGRIQRDFRKLIFQLILVNDGWSISCEIVLEWMSMDLTDGKLTLVQVLAWCCQATSHYLSQCWPRSLSSYDIIRPQWVKSSLTPDLRPVSPCGSWRWGSAKQTRPMFPETTPTWVPQSPGSSSVQRPGCYGDRCRPAPWRSQWNLHSL